jgi:hypothetical protein
MYVTYCVYLVGIKEMIDCKNVWSGKLQNSGFWGI